jgi:IS30 family transposase
VTTRVAPAVSAGRSAHSIATELGRAVSTVAREIKRNTTKGEYRPHTARAMMLARRPRPKARRLQQDAALRALVQLYLDQRWSPEQVVQELQRSHGQRIAVETVYQALYSPQRVVHREPSDVLRSGRPYRRPGRRGDVDRRAG